MRIGKSRAKLKRLFVFGALSLLVVMGFAWQAIPLRSFESVRQSYQASDVWVTDREGHPLESVRTDDQRRSLDWVAWSDVSPAFQSMLVAVEDRRFYYHPGVDAIAIVKAVGERFSQGSRRGASTLTMQLVGLLQEGKFGRRRNVWEKLQQMASAVKLSVLWSKEHVLEAYVNLAPFRGELVGLRAASLGYFAKNPSGLVPNESALLIALLRAPNATPELVARRACRMLKVSDCASMQSYARQILSKPYRLARSRELIPILSKNFIVDGPNQSVIQTSLDGRVQELALKLLREQLHTLKAQNVQDGAVLVLETQTGRVVAYIANAGSGYSSAEQIDGIVARRQAGSTLKPFVYATAFDWRLLDASSLLDDSPADIAVSLGRVYNPKNYDHIFRGLVSAGDALGSSLNVPAVRALQLVGETRVLDRLRSLGFEELQDDEFYGPSLALGAMDVTLWELTKAYRQFGVDEATFSPATRQSIFNILASPEHRRFTFGMDSPLTLSFPAAVKTGTSKDMRDNWCIGWTADYTVGVWVGNFNGEPMWNVSGMSGAAPVWRSLMLALHPNPKGAISKYERPAEPLPRRTISRIRYPAADMLIGLDPDIPAALQKLPIEIENPQKDLKVYVNQRLLSQGQETTLWALQKGKFLVELQGSAGEVVDALRFEVR